MTTRQQVAIKSRPRRIVVRGLLVLCGVYLLYTAARTTILMGNAKQLIASADSWPREYSVGATGARELTYVVMGDSTAVGVGAASLEKSYPFQIATNAAAKGRRVRVINIAVSGARLSDVLQKQLPQILKLEPQLISLSIGANDATHFTSKAQYKKEITTLISALAQSKAVILLASAPDMAQIPALPLPLVLAVNERAKMQNRILKSRLNNTNIRYVDLFNRGKLVYSQNSELYAKDFFHPSSSGYQIWADLFAQEMKAMP